MKDFLAIDIDISMSTATTSPAYATINAYIECAQPGLSTETTSKAESSTTTSLKRKRNVTEPVDDAPSLMVNKLRTLQEKPKLNFIEEFGKFFTSSLSEMTDEQRNICITLGLDCVRMGKCETLTADHQLVAVARLTQVSI